MSGIIDKFKKLLYKFKSASVEGNTLITGSRSVL